MSDGPLVAVIPCYNPGPAVVDVIKQTRAQVDGLLVVDDGSDATTVDLLRDTGVECLRFPVNLGKGHAIVAGLRRWLGEGEWSAVVLLDADGQHDPGEIAALREAWAHGRGDLVIGARTGDWSAVPASRRWANRASTVLLSRLCGQPIVDSQSGFRLLAHPVVERLAPSLAGGRYETESALLIRAARAGFRIVSVPVHLIAPREDVPSHFRALADSLRIAWTLARHTAGSGSAP